MAGKNSGLGSVLPKSVIDQLVPKSKGLGDLLSIYGQGLIKGEGPTAKTFIPPVKNMEQMYGKPDTFGGEALNFLMDIPLAGLEAGRIATGIPSAFTNPGGNILVDLISQPSDEKRGKDALKLLDTSMKDILGKTGTSFNNQRNKELADLEQSLQQITGKRDKPKAQVDSFGDVAGESSVETSTGTGKFLDPEAEAAIAQQEIDKKADEIAKDAVLAAEDDAEANAGQDLPVSAENALKQKQQSLFKSAMEDFSSIYGDDKKPSGAKTIEQYKEDFAKATGIDVSGEPDNKLALMSLGLSLMQNRAGKGFNLSNIIGAAGEAGQKALPLFEKAKQEARAGQVASGKFALQETKADTVAKAAFLKEKRTALNTLSKETRDQQGKYIIQAMKDKNDLDVAMINARAKAIKDGKLNLKKSISQQVQGLKGVEVQFGFDQNGSEKILNPTSSARGLADGYGNLLQANDSIDYLLNVNKEIAQAGSPAAYLLTERAKGLLTTLGVRGEELFEDQTYEDANGDKIVMKGISKEAGAKAVQDRLLAQFKRFLSQETGNGISNVDFKNLEKQVGRIDLATNPNERIMRLNELKKMFAVPMNRVKSLFDQLNDRRFHTNDDNYTRTQEILLDVLKRSTPKQYQNRISIDESGGIQIIDVTG